MNTQAQTVHPLENYYKRHVVGSVTFDEQGRVVPFDRPTVKGLRKAEQVTTRCYVRDIEAHETVEVQLVAGNWQRCQEQVAI